MPTLIARLVKSAALVLACCASPAFCGDAPAPPEVTPGSIAVRDFGATGDGTHDDTSALQAALGVVARAGYGRLVFEPSGVYRTSRALTLSNSRLEIEGRGATIKPLDAAPLSVEAGCSLLLKRCSNVRITSLNFDGNRTRRGRVNRDNAQSSLGLWGCRDVDLYDCRFTDAINDDLFIAAADGGLSPVRDTLTASQWVRVHGCKFLGPPYRQQVSIIHGRHITVDHNQFRDQRSPFTGVSIDIEANGGDADGINSDIAVEDNVFDNCHLALIINSRARPLHISASHNRISGGDYGISNWAGGTVITGNIMHDMANICIGSGNGGTAVIDGNILEACKSVGIHVDTVGPGQIVSNNVLTDVGLPDTGVAIQTAPAGGGVVVRGNQLRVTTPRPQSSPIQHHPNDSLQQNNLSGYSTTDGVNR